MLGITSVAGNVPLALTTKNALKIARARRARRRAGLCRRGGAAGAAAVTAEYVHGSTGLDGPDLPEPTLTARDGHAVGLHRRHAARASPAGTVTLCALGPMTNIAMAFARAPEIVGRVARIVAMGGAWSEGGNTTPAAEFNIYADPHAARCRLPRRRAHRAAPARRHPQVA